jgi:hypothetical protein
MLTEIEVDLADVYTGRSFDVSSFLDPIYYPFGPAK